MCDNPDMNPWDVLVNPILTQNILENLMVRAREEGIEQIQKDLPSLENVSSDELQSFFRGIESKKVAIDDGTEMKLAHIEFDIDRLKELPERELQDLLSQKLVSRIIKDIQELEINRPIPDWCYAFF